MPEDDRTFITMHDGVHDHPKVVGLSDAAFRWWHELICWCSKNRTDGRVPRGQWMKARPKVRRELLDAVPGYDPLVIDRGERGVEVHDYLEHQRSAAQIAELSEQKRRAGAKGNHDRWHVGPAGRPRADCPLCVAAPPPGSSPPPSRNGSHPRSHPRSHVGSQKGSQTSRETSPETEEFLRNSHAETDLPAGQDLGGSSGNERAGRRPDPPKAKKPQANDSPCGLHPDDDRACRRCRDVRLATEQANRDDRRAAVIASIPARLCPMCDADGRLLEVGRFLPVSPTTSCDHETDHDVQVARAEEAS